MNEHINRTWLLRFYLSWLVGKPLLPSYWLGPFLLMSIWTQQNHFSHAFDLSFICGKTSRIVLTFPMLFCLVGNKRHGRELPQKLSTLICWMNQHATACSFWLLQTYEGWGLSSVSMTVQSSVIQVLVFLPLSSQPVALSKICIVSRI